MGLAYVAKCCLVLCDDECSVLGALRATWIEWHLISQIDSPSPLDPL